MKSCTIIISTFESQDFLRACIRSIKKYANENVQQKIIVADQSNRNIHTQIVDEYKDDSEVKIVWMQGLYSGFGLDHIFRSEDIDTEYICQIHVDVAAISKQWLLLPITLIEKNGFSFVGQLQFISKLTDTIYPNDVPFFAMAQCYNIAKTETYKEMSLEAGFTRFHNRPRAGMIWNNNDWNEWAKEDYEARGSDDDVVAFYWESKYRNTNKLGLAISGFISPAFGRIIDGLVFHFCSCRESLGTNGAMGEQYQEYTRRINEDYSEQLLEEMIELANKNKPPEMEILSRNFWDGKLKKHFPTSDELNKRIEELKNIQ